MNETKYRTFKQSEANKVFSAGGATKVILNPVLINVLALGFLLRGTNRGTNRGFIA